jgi:hypothetical protein
VETPLGKKIMAEDAKKILVQYEALKSERATWESHWQEVAEYVMPDKANFVNVMTPGSKIGANIADASAIRAHEILSAGLHGNLTSPSAPWFSLKIEGKDLNSKEVRQWLKDVEAEIYLALNETNWNQEIYATYEELTGFGTSPLCVEEDQDKAIKFNSRPLSECLIEEDALGNVDTVFRLFKMTVRQMVEEFGLDKLSKPAKDVWEKENKPDQQFDIIHAVYPRYNRVPKSGLSINKKWASVYLEKDSGHILRESGFDEFPYLVPRWSKSSNEVYGRSPAMKALPDIKMLNAMSKTNIRAAQKAVDPPLQIPWNMFVSPMKTNPGGANLVRLDMMATGVKELPHAQNLPIGLEMEDRRREFIKEAFHVNLFLMLEQPRPMMTATEVMERVEEKMVVLGPVIGRLQTELLSPLIDKVYRIIKNAGRLPEVPPELEGKKFDIEYISPLARAQKFQQILAMQRGLNYVGMLANYDPTIIRKVNAPKIVEHVWQALNISPDTLRDEKDFQAEVQQMMEQQQQLQAMQAGSGVSDSAAKLLKALPEDVARKVLAGGNGEVSV